MLGGLEGDSREVSPESSKWLKAAQHYVIKPGSEEVTALPKALREV